MILSYQSVAIDQSTLECNDAPTCVHQPTKNDLRLQDI
jgi:hypothetical protein